MMNFLDFLLFVVQSSFRFLFVVIIFDEIRFLVCSSSKSTDRSLALSSDNPAHISRISAEKTLRVNKFIFIELAKNEDEEDGNFLFSLLFHFSYEFILGLFFQDVYFIDFPLL